MLTGRFPRPRTPSVWAVAAMLAASVPFLGALSPDREFHTYRPRAFIAGVTVTRFAALALVLLLVARGRRLAEPEGHGSLAVSHVDT